MNTLEFVSTLKNSNFLQGVNQMDAALQKAMKTGVGLERIQKRLGGFKENLMKLGGAGLGFGMFIKEGAEFEKAMDVATGKLDGVKKGSKVFNDLKKNVVDLGASTLASSQQVAQMVDALAAGGVGVEDMTKESLKAIVNFSVAGETDARTAVEMITGFKNAMGGTFEELGDEIVQASNSSNASILSIGDSLKLMAATAKLAGQSKESVLAWVGALANVNITGTMAGTTMSMFYGQMAKRKDLFKSLGIDVGRNGKFRDAIDVFKELVAKTKNMDQVAKVNLYKKLFGEEGKKAATIDPAAYDKILSDIQHSKGKMTEIAERNANNVMGDLEQLSGAFESFRISIFDVFHDDLRKIIPTLQDFLNGIKDFFVAHPMMVKGLVGIGLGFLGIKTALSGLLIPLIAFNQLLLMKNSFAFLKGLVLLRSAVLGFIPAVWSLTTALLVNPIFLGIAAVAGLIAGFGYLYTHSQRFKTMITSVGTILWSWTKTVASIAWGIAKWLPPFLILRGIFFAISWIFKGISAGIKELIGWAENSTFLKMLGSKVSMGVAAVEKTVNEKAAGIRKEEVAHSHELTIKTDKGVNVTDVKTTGGMPMKFNTGVSY